MWGSMASMLDCSSLCSLEDQRQQLAPAVRAWQAYEAQHAQFLVQKRAFLNEYAEYLQLKAAANEEQV